MNLSDYISFWSHMDEKLYKRFLGYYNDRPNIKDREKLFNQSNPYGLDIKLRTVK